MSDFGSNPGDIFAHNLQDLIHGITSGIQDASDGITGGIDHLIHAGAVGLLHALLPQMVHANTAVVKSGGWLAVAGASHVVQSTLGAADLSNKVLAGMVAKKVGEGVTHLNTHTYYEIGVNSIAW